VWYLILVEKGVKNRGGEREYERKAKAKQGERHWERKVTVRGGVSFQNHGKGG